MLRRLLVATAILFATSSAHANSRLPATNQMVIAADDPSFMLLRTTFGFLFSSDAGKTWDWLCEGALSQTGQLDPAVALLNGGAVLSAESGLAVSPDRGCSWSLVAGLETTIVPDVARAGDGATAIAVKNIYAYADAGTSIFDTAILRTTDSGKTWQPLSGVVDPVLTIDTIDLAKSDPQRIYVTGIQYGSIIAKILVSIDGGSTYAEHDIPLVKGENGAYIAAVDPNNADLVYVRTLGVSADNTTLVSRLLVTNDAGKTFTEHWSGDKMQGFALSPDGTRVYLGSTGAGLLVANASDLVFTQKSALAIQCLATSGSTLYACSSEPSAHAVTGTAFVLGASTDEGTTFAPLLALSGIRGPLQCPPQSIATTTCGPLWPILAEQLAIDAGTTTNDAGTKPPPSTCGCETGGSSSSFVVLLIAAIVLVAKRISGSAASS